MATYRLMDGVAGRPGVGSSGTQPPSAGTTYSGPWEAGIVFKLTSGGLWFQGYWWWVPATNSPVTPQVFALWDVQTSSAGVLVAGGTVTSGTFTAGQWNYVPLTTPLLLTAEVPYVAATGFVSTTGVSATVSQFDVGDPYASGVTNGPLYMPPIGALSVTAQMPYNPTVSDPTASMPYSNNTAGNWWIDVQVTDQPPANATYRAWPNMPTPYPGSTNNTQTTSYTLGMEFSLSQACTVQKIWHWSPPGAATIFPSRTTVWDVASQTAVPLSDNSSPAWLDPGGASATPGDGWVYVDYSSSGLTLSPGVNYKVSTYSPGGNPWFGVSAGVFGTGEIFGAGFTQGPLTILNSAEATPGQQSWDTSAFGYPGTSFSDEADWIDIEVSLPSAPPGPPPAYTAFMASM